MHEELAGNCLLHCDQSAIKAGLSVCTLLREIIWLVGLVNLTARTALIEATGTPIKLKEVGAALMLLADDEDPSGAPLSGICTGLVGSLLVMTSRPVSLEVVFGAYCNNKVQLIVGFSEAGQLELTVKLPVAVMSLIVRRAVPVLVRRIVCKGVDVLNWPNVVGLVASAGAPFDEVFPNLATSAVIKGLLRSLVLMLRVCSQ